MFQPDFYTKSIQQNLELLAAWPPDQKISIGDVGVLRGAAFSRKTTLRQQEIEFHTQTVSSDSSITHSSEHVSIDLQGTLEAASSLLPSSSSIRVSFGKKDSIIFHADGCKVRAIKDVDEVEQQIQNKYKSGAWKSEWVVVTEVTQCATCFVLISGKDGAQIELGSESELPGNINLAKLIGKLGIKSSSGISSQFILERPSTPLYRAIGLSRGILGLGKLTITTPNHDGVSEARMHRE